MYTGTGKSSINFRNHVFVIHCFAISKKQLENKISCWMYVSLSGPNITVEDICNKSVGVQCSSSGIRSMERILKVKTGSHVTEKLT